MGPTESPLGGRPPGSRLARQGNDFGPLTIVSPPQSPLCEAPRKTRRAQLPAPGRTHSVEGEPPWNSRAAPGSGGSRKVSETWVSERAKRDLAPLGTIGPARMTTIRGPLSGVSESRADGEGQQQHPPKNISFHPSRSSLFRLRQPLPAFRGERPGLKLSRCSSLLPRSRPSAAPRLWP